MQAVFSTKRWTLSEGAIVSADGITNDPVESSVGFTKDNGLPDSSGVKRANHNGTKPRENAAERVYNALRRSILTLEVVPGHMLSRAGLAGQYSVSQTPVRETLLRLEQEGLVEVFPQARTLVSRIDLRALFEAQFQRVALEVEVVRRLARRPEAPDVLRAGEIFGMQTQLWQKAATFTEVHPLTGDFVMDMARLDRAFHEALFDGVGMGRVYAALFAHLGPLERCRAIQPLSPEQHGTALQFHGDILARIRARDPAGAEAAMRAHLAHGLRQITQLAKQCPDYFK